MKSHSLCIAVIICVAACLWSCKDVSKMSGVRSEKIYLQDSLFILELQVPERMDTFFTWVDWDDTNCGDDKKYRFSVTGFPNIPESGFFYKEYSDSSFQITVKHIHHYECGFLDTRVDGAAVLAAMEKEAKYFNDPFEGHSFERINAGELRYDKIVYKAKPFHEQRYMSTIVGLFTTLNGFNFTIEFECSTKDCPGFVELANRSANTIRLYKNPDKEILKYEERLRNYYRQKVHG